VGKPLHTEEEKEAAMYTRPTRTQEYGAVGPTLYLAFELGAAKWKLGFSVGVEHRPGERTLPAGDLVQLEREIELAKKRFGRPATQSREPEQWFIYLTPGA
jgi:hypothetical protein